jgi:hypothetical protein
MGEIEMNIKFYWQNLKVRDHVGGIGVDWKIMER